MQKQMYSYFNKTPLKFKCGFRKNYSAQQHLIAMVEKLQQSFSKGDTDAPLLTDMQEAFDILPHDF